MESLLVPYQAIDCLPARRPLVLAPHPDDETFGCGGTLARMAMGGAAVRVVVLTDGAARAKDAAAKRDERERESLVAAEKLGLPPPVFWRLPDRDLRYSEALVDRIAAAIVDWRADGVLAPSAMEVHPDHYAVALAAAEAVRRQPAGLTIAFYEVGMPLHPNTLVDITPVAEKKQAAMASFRSELAFQPYDEHIAALNRYRTFTLPRTVAAAEAFLLIDGETLQRDWLAIFADETRLRRQAGLTVRPDEDLPLVSVLIRSMDRPTLAEALDSVALQTYPNIEIVVVAACGPGHRPLPDHWGPHLLTLASGDEALERSRSANLAIERSRGRYLLFLDDDDLLLPNHLARLVDALKEGKERAAYAGVRMVDGNGRTMRIFDDPWSLARLRGANFLPIHSVLFEKSLTDQGCRFDEDLECMEDWDFWLQVACKTGFSHVPGIGAVYRFGLGTSALTGSGNAEVHLSNRSRIFLKWAQLFSPSDWAESHFWFENELNHLRSLTEICSDRLLLANEQAAADEKTIAALERSVSAHQQTIDALLASTSWKATAPIRFLSQLMRRRFGISRPLLRQGVRRAGRAVYWRLPARWRQPLVGVVYRIAGPVFAGMGHYEMWRRRQGTGNMPPLAIGMTDIDAVAPMHGIPDGRIAIHVHMYYPDLAPEFSQYLRHMPYDYDLYVSVTDNAAARACRETFCRLPKLGQLTVEVAPNRGRDLAPLFCTFGAALRDYAFIAHIHTKKSLYNRGATEGWRKYLLDGLFGSGERIRRIFALLEGRNGIGIVYPQNYSGIPYMANTWLANRGPGEAWCRRLGIVEVPAGYFDYPVGAMFWARGEALRSLFDSPLRFDDFPEESGQTDGTLAHCLERLFVMVAQRHGHAAAIMRDAQSPDWSRWRFGQYLRRRREEVELSVTDSGIRVVIFDIFDTLLLRPLLDPEAIKTIVARQVGDDVGRAYLQWRAEAERDARLKTGRDIGLDEIFSEFRAMSGLPNELADTLRRIEETAERNSVAPRPDVVALLAVARAAGKRILLASDMFLPKAAIEAMLVENGIVGWHDMYLSSDSGLRKDTGDLYRRILEREQVAAHEILVVGDNERSDFQIPCDMGMKFCHVLRPVELARALPRLGPAVERVRNAQRLDDQLVLGLIVRRHLQPLFFSEFDPSTLLPTSPHAIGYAVLGPLVLAFAQWLAVRAREDGIERLFFLAREGQFLKHIHDRWHAATGIGPAGEYLVLSRRAVTVPMIRGMDDILAIAAARYFPNTTADFLHERFGLDLDAAAWTELRNLGLGDGSRIIEIRDGEIGHVVPLLETLANRIVAQGRNERRDLIAYLDRMRMTENIECALVDVGYSGTIQASLNRLLERRIHGYYMLTDQKAAHCETLGARIQGCFGHLIPHGPEAPALMRESFTLEKLLSSDDTQVVRYRIDKDGSLQPEFRPLSDAEYRTRSVRAEIRAGARAFVDEALAVRNKLLPDFVIDPNMATMLFETFIDSPAPAEKNILDALVLDDHYCGRGLVG